MSLGAGKANRSLRAGGSPSGASGESNARTGETYNDFNQLTALTTGATTHHYTYAGTDSSARLTADTTTDEGPLGISTTTSGSGGKTGFIRDPAGTLIGMTTGGKTYYYLMGARYYDPSTARFTQTDPSGQETNAYLYAAGDPHQ
ncbi:RHS repeat-associated core domain-containing protein [Streptomyces sp. NPDC056580]|uniref:RHS repeat-associated core domain-containing protein n=1 Tax=Streptomyces sp. NPDC056580 TaxID=3345872 RepID=UPI0036C8C001